VEHGQEMEESVLIRLIPSYLPDAALATKPAEQWAPLIEKFHAKGEFTKKGHPSGKVKEDVVTFAKDQWPLLFSRFYEAYKFSGPSLPKNDVIIAVNWSGVYVVDDQENVLLACSYPEITTVSSNKTAGKLFHQISFVLPLFSARVLWQIALPPVGGVAAICHRPLGVWHPKKVAKPDQF
jgi:myosin-7